MFDSRALRSAALGYGLSFLSILPVAEGSISNAAASQALGSYFYDSTHRLTPDERSYTPAAEVRAYTPAAETRAYTPLAETRAWSATP